VWRTVLVGVTLGVLMVLFAAPPTRWLARKQFAGVGFTLPQSNPQNWTGITTRRLRAAQRFPNDLDVQIAAALDRAELQYSSTTDMHTLRQAALHSLVPRFGDRPALYATMLRYDTTGAVHMARPDAWPLTQSTPPPDTKFTPPDPAVLAAFDAEAAAGEHLDPQNGFFPIMRALGLFDAHRDAAALAAVRRAGRAPLWNDYVQDETNGHLRLAEAADGPQSVMDRTAITAAALLPHFARMRAIARFATFKAMQMEQAGNVEQGLAVRRAVMAVGDRMRVQSTTLVGALVGMGVAALATDRPGGAAILPQDAPDELSLAQRGHEVGAQRTEQFAAYAIRAGHPEDAALVRAQFAAGEAERAVWNKSQSVALWNHLLAQGAWWIADEVTLIAAFWLLLLGGAARMLSRRAAFQEARPLPRSTVWGMAMAIALGLAVAGRNSTTDAELQASFVLGSIMAVVVGLGALFLVRRRLTRHAVARGARALGVTALLLGAAAAVLYWQGRGISDIIVLQQAWQVELSGGLTGNSSTLINAMVRQFLLALAMAAVPLVMLLTFTLAGWARRVPVNVAVVRGFLSAAVPVACVLFLVWSGLCLATLRQERQMNAELNQMRTHEGRYLASLAGMAWPGPVVH